MKAIYESSNPYVQVGYWDVNGVIPVRGMYTGKEIVGSAVQAPDSFSECTHFYHFNDGEQHNQLTLVEPVEILNMRAWVKAHPDFTEVSCEDVPEDLKGYIQSLKAEEPKKEVQAVHMVQDTSSEDWDREMAKRIMR